MQVVTDALQRKLLMQIFTHDSGMFSIIFNHATCKITRIRTCATEIRHVEEKSGFLKISLYMPVKHFRPIVAYYIMANTHIQGYVYTEPCRPLYNSLDVRYIVSFYNYTFESEITSGHVVTLALGQVVTFTVEQIVCIFGGESCKL